MTPQKLDLLIVTFSYGGNGGIASSSPEVGDWLLQIVPEMTADERLGRIKKVDLCDTPITMTRNKSVELARQAGFDIILMIDSDMAPDLYTQKYQDPEAKPFWKTSFEFLYKHYARGPVMVAAPYCGPPPIENCYAFRWANKQSEHPDDCDMQLVQYSREEAVDLIGIQEAAAVPTGISLWDVRLFELTEPKDSGDRPWFFYEYTTILKTEKASTEDVTASREVSLAGIEVLGYNPVFVNWDAWAGHVKQKVVGKPMLLAADAVSKNLCRAARTRLPANEKRTVMRSDIAEEIDWSKATRLEAAVRLPEANVPTRPGGNGEKSGPWKKYTRIINGREVTSLGFQTSDADLACLSAWVKSLLPAPNNYLKVAEIGSWVGESALAIIFGMQGRSGVVYCIDTWQGSPGSSDATGGIAEQFGGPEALREQFNKNVEPYLVGSVAHAQSRDRLTINPMQMTSQEAAKQFTGHPYHPQLDMVFIDGDHRYSECLADIKRWITKIRPGGVICGHDYHDSGFPGVEEAVKAFFRPEEIIHPEGTHLWVVKIPEPAVVGVDGVQVGVQMDEATEPQGEEVS